MRPLFALHTFWIVAADPTQIECTLKSSDLMPERVAGGSLRRHIGQSRKVSQESEEASVQPWEHDHRLLRGDEQAHRRGPRLPH